MTVEVRLATEEDNEIPAYDYTALSAVATCPTWGITRYVAHRTMSGDGRAMALEAGSVIHECAAAISLWQLRHQGLDNHRTHHQEQEFGRSRSEFIFSGVDERESVATQLRRICERVIESSDFYDDPADTKRTITNIEDCVSYYIDRHPWTTKPIWVRDPDDPTSDVGIEMPVNMVVRTPHRTIRYTGKADAIRWTNEQMEELSVDDVKTTSMNMQESWDASFILSHQFTGYMVYASVFTGRPVWNGTIHGIRVPVPKTNVHNGIKFLPIQRGQHHIDQWAQFIDWAVDIIEANKEEPWNAPKFTHSCNRFFRPCSFIPMCDGDEAWRKEAFEEMEVDEWNPLADE